MNANPKATINFNTDEEKKDRKKKALSRIVENRKYFKDVEPNITIQIAKASKINDI